MRRVFLPMPIIDAHRPRRIAELIGILFLLSLSDLVFTLWAHVFTPFHELNPIARSLLNSGRIPELIAGKLLLTMLGAAIFWTLRRHLRAEMALWCVIGVYVALAFRWADYTLAYAMP
jgi:hypothetical protein